MTMMLPAFKTTSRREGPSPAIFPVIDDNNDIRF